MSNQLLNLACKPPLRIGKWRGTSNKLVVVFSGVGADPNSCPPFEFVKMATQDQANHALFISDRDRSWLNAGSISDQIVDAIKQTAAQIENCEIHLIGNSMGGSMALMLKDQVAAKTVLALVPQYSICPDIVPQEKRWMRFRKKIVHFKYREVTLTPNRNQTVFIVHGGSPDELVHAEKFPDVPGIRQFILPKLDHNLSRSLKQNKQLHLLISAALGGHTQRFRRLIEHSDGLFLQRYLAASPPTFAPQPVAE